MLGQIHPLVAKNYGVDEEIYCAELDFGALLAARGAEPVYTPLPRFPAVTRDLSVVCEEGKTVGELTEAIRAHGGRYLESVRFVDVYRGAPILPGYKSFALTMHDAEQTLTADHADETVAAILGGLNADHGAVIR